MSIYSFASPNQSNANPVGYEYLDGGRIIHLWNNFTIDMRTGDVGNDYYINTTSGLQITNYYNQPWSKNELCGTINVSSVFNEYCTDALPFGWTASTDNNTYAAFYGNKTIILTGGRKIDFFFGYNLSQKSNNISIITKISNLGPVSIPYNTGIAWKTNDIQIAMNQSENFIDIGEGISIQLNGTHDEEYTHTLGDMFAIWKYFNESVNGRPDLKLYFDNLTNYRLKIKSEDGQYNAPITLYTTLGAIDAFETKTVTLGWIDVPRTPVCTGTVIDNQVTMSFLMNRTIGVNSSVSETQPFNVSTYYTGTCSGKTPCSCNSWTDNVLYNDFSQINTEYPTNFNSAELKNITKYGNSSVDDFQGYQMRFGIRINNTVVCGVIDGPAETQAWYGGYIDRLNFSCMDVQKPQLTTAVMPLNNSIQNSTNVTFQINASDNTNLMRIEFYENWTKTDGTYTLNQTRNIYGLGGVYLNYNHTWNFTMLVPVGNHSWYVRLNDTNTENTNISDIYVFTIEPVKNETEARQAIVEGITSSIPAATITTDQQIYIVDSAGQHSLGRFDKSAASGNQRWAFNYITGIETFTGIISLLRTVNIWENQSLTYDQIVQQVKSFINRTKVG